MPSEVVLRVLGSPDLGGVDLPEAHQVLAHPKRLALLTYLTLAGPRGFHRREELFGLLWPESDSERAHNSLRQAVHQIRRVLGPDAIVARGDEELGLGACMTSDAARFVRAIETKDFAGALDLYRGDLLAAFHLSEAPAFEEWLDHERGRLRAMASNAAWILSRQCEAAGQPGDAATWARVAAGRDSLDEVAQQRLIVTLDRLGDRAGALRVYDDFAGKLRDEFDAAPAAETQALVAGVRARSAPLAPATRLGPAVPPDTSASMPEPSSSPSSRRPSRRAWLLYTAGVLTVLILAAIRAKATPDGAAPGGDRHWVLVAEFAGPADDPQLAAVARDLIRAKLDQSSLLTSVPDEQIAAALEASGRDPMIQVRGEVARDVAYRSSARVVVEGRVSRSGGRYGVIVRAIDVNGGAARVSLSEVAPTEDALIPTMDAMARRLLEALGEQPLALQRDHPLMHVRTASLPALRLYVEAARGDDGEFAGAIQLLRRAVILDPAFASAWRLLGDFYGNRRRYDSASAAYSEALRWPARLTARELLLTRFAHELQVRYDLPAAYRVALEMTAAFPTDVECWHDRGWLEIHAGRLEASRASAEMALENASVPGGGPLTRANLGLSLISLGLLDSASRVVSTLPGWLGQHQRLWLALAHSRWSDADTIAASMIASPHLPEESKVLALQAAAALAAVRGEVNRAYRMLDDAGADIRPGNVNYLWRARALLRLASGVAAPSPRLMPDLRTNEGLAAQTLWLGSQGLRADALRAAARLRGRRPINLPMFSFALVIADAFEAFGRGASDEAIGGLSGYALNRGWGWEEFDSRLPARWILAESYEELGRLDSAAAVFERIVSPVGIGDAPERRPFALPFAHRRLAILYQRLNRPADALRHWRAFLDLVKAPDPELRALVHEARVADGVQSELARLSPR